MRRSSILGELGQSQRNISFRKLVVSALIMQDERVLMVRQGRGRNRGKWNLPGGKVDAGETAIAAVVREVLEETGFVIAVQALAGVYDYESRRGKPRARVGFHAEVVGGELECDGREIVDVCWMELLRVIKLPDRKLCRPSVVRRMLADLEASVTYPLSMAKRLIA